MVFNIPILQKQPLLLESHCDGIIKQLMLKSEGQTKMTRDIVKNKCWVLQNDISSGVYNSILFCRHTHILLLLLALLVLKVITYILRGKYDLSATGQLMAGTHYKTFA